MLARIASCGSYFVSNQPYMYSNWYYINQTVHVNVRHINLTAVDTAMQAYSYSLTHKGRVNIKILSYWFG